MDKDKKENKSSQEKEEVKNQKSSPVEEERDRELEKDMPSESAQEAAEDEIDLSSDELLMNKIKEEESRAETLLEDLKRLKADFENYKKRMIKEQTNYLQLATGELITDLLPVIDNLERAIQATENHKDERTIREGIEMVSNQFLGVLRKQGLEEINPIGEIFNPEEHEAVLQVESEEHPEDTVTEVLQKGYRLKNKILRHAMVKVAR